MNAYEVIVTVVLSVLFLLSVVTIWALKARGEEVVQLRMANDRQRGDRDYWKRMAEHYRHELGLEQTRHVDTQDTLALVEDINRALLVTNTHYAEDEQARRDRAAARKSSRKGVTA